MATLRRMTLRIALLAAATVAAPVLLIPATATAAPCVPGVAGRWCFDSGDPTDLPCIEGSFDPVGARLVECPS